MGWERSDNSRRKGSQQAEDAKALGARWDAGAEATIDGVPCLLIALKDEADGILPEGFIEAANDVEEDRHSLFAREGFLHMCPNAVQRLFGDDICLIGSHCPQGCDNSAGMLGTSPGINKGCGDEADEIVLPVIRRR